MRKKVDLKNLKDKALPEKLLTMQPEAAEKAFNELPLETKVEIVLSVPWKKRIEIIMLAENSRELVQALPEEEVYWTVKERGAADCLAIISRTNHEQFQYMIDLDCWNKDCLDIKNLTTWYGLLSRCNESKVLEWLSKADDEFLVSSFKKYMKVFKIESESDISEEYDNMPSATLDGVNFFKFSDDEAGLFMMPILNVLYEHNNARFYSLIEGVIWDFEIEAEDTAFRWRQSRMSEKGFADLDEAMDVYQLISDKEIDSVKQCTDTCRNSSVKASGSSIAINLSYTFSQNKRPLFLFNVVKNSDRELLSSDLQKKIVSIANKIIMADCLEIREIADMKRALRKAEGYINIGLEYLSEGNTGSAEVYLQEIHPAILFRIGYSTVFKLKTKAEKLFSSFWTAYKEMFPAFFATPWADAFAGLKKIRPLFFTGVTDLAAAHYRDFETIDEVNETEHILDIVEVAHKLIFEFFKIKPEDLFEDFILKTTLNDCSELKSSSVFLTVLANYILHGRTELEPVTIEDLKCFMDRVFVPKNSSGRRTVKKEIHDNCILWIFSNNLIEESKKSALRSFVRACLDLFEEEFSSLAEKKKIDTRYISGLILKKEMQVPKI